MVLVKKWHFFLLFIRGKIVQGNVFQNSLDRQNAFLDYKNNKLKKAIVLVKNWQFLHVILGKSDKGNVFYDILERKNAFLDY